MRDRTVLITGATSGIGFATAAGLARLGARVVLVSRDPGRGERARQALAASTGWNDLEVLHADLASLASLRHLAATFLERHDRLDVLVNNAGVVESRRRLSVDGIELTFAVNVVAPFLLTSLLLDRLRQSAPARIVNVSSVAADHATIDLDDPQFARRRYRMLPAYGQSKLALNMLTAELARRLRGTGVSANALHPGIVATNFANRDPLMRLAWRLARRFMLSSEAGARTSIYVAAAPEVGEVSGGYFVKQRLARPNPTSNDPGAAARLWKMLDDLVQSPRAAQGGQLR